MNQFGGYDSDAEGGGGNHQSAAEGFEGAFGDKAVRRGFIRKVYGILSIQLAVTVAFICMFLYIEPIKQTAYDSPWMYWVAFIVLFACMIAMACSESIRRKSPTNFIFLGVFTCKLVSIYLSLKAWICHSLISLQVVRASCLAQSLPTLMPNPCWLPLGFAPVLRLDSQYSPSKPSGISQCVEECSVDYSWCLCLLDSCLSFCPPTSKARFDIS